MGKSASDVDVLATDKLCQDLGDKQCATLHGLLSTERFSHGANFEKLGVAKGSLNVYSLRLNQKARILITKHEVGDTSAWVVLDYLEHHEYDKSPFLKAGYLKHYLSLENTLKELKSIAPSGLTSIKTINSVPASEAKIGSAPGAAVTTSFAASAGVQKHVIQELHSFNGELIVLNPEQEQALKLAEPMLITGMPGSGKSCVAVTYLTQCIERTAAGASDDTADMLYVAESELLVRQMEASFRASLLGQTFEGRRVVFLSYDALLRRVFPELKEFQKAGMVEFSAWFNSLERKELNGLKKHHGSKAAELVYQELRMMSGMSLAEYEGIGARGSALWNVGSSQRRSKAKPRAGKTSTAGSVLDKEEKAILREVIYNLKDEYVRHLVSIRHYDSSFWLLPSQNRIRFRHIAVDEAQDFSTGQLNNLYELARQDKKSARVAYFADSHQSVKDNFPKHHFFKTILGITNLGVLPGTYRCSKAVLDVANAVLDMKHFVMGGLIEKDALPFIQTSAGSVAGGACWVPEQTAKQDSAIQQRLITLTNSTLCAVITAEDYVTEAKNRFPKAIVLTPQQAKGLEYDHIILYRLLEHPSYKDMNPLLADYQRGGADASVHRAKAGTANYEYNALLNALFTAITRARNQLYLLLPDDRTIHPIRHLVNALKQALPPVNLAPPVSAVFASSNTDWSGEIRRQLTNGNRSVALYLAKEHLGLEESQFNQQFADDSKEKSELAKDQASNKKAEFSKDEQPGLKNKIETMNQAGKKEIKRYPEASKATPVLLGRKKKPSKKTVTPTMQAVLEAPYEQVFMPMHTLLQQPDFMEQLFHIDVGSGSCLLEILSPPKYTFLFSMIKAFIAKDASFAKKITLNDLCRARRWSRPLVNSSPLCEMVLSPSGIEILDLLSNMFYEEWMSKSVFQQALFTSFSEAPRDKKSNALFLLYSIPEGLGLLNKLISRNPKLWATNDFVTAIYCSGVVGFYVLCKSPQGQALLNTLFSTDSSIFATKKLVETLRFPIYEASGEDINVSSLYWLCCFPVGQILLDKFIDTNPRLFATNEFLAALCLTCTTATDTNVSGLYWLCKGTKGRSLLDKLLTINPSIFFSSKKFVEALYLTRTCVEKDIKIVNVSGLYWLCGDSEAIVLLEKLFDNNPDLFATKEFVAALCLSRDATAGEHANWNGLSRLCATLEGSRLLGKIIAANPNLFITQELVDALCILAPENAGARGNTSGIYWLCKTFEGQGVLSRLIDINPHLCRSSVFIVALKQVCSATKSINAKSALSLLQEFGEGVILLDKIMKYNPGIRSEIVPAKQDVELETSVIDTQDQRFFSAVLPSRIVTAASDASAPTTARAAS